MLNRRIVQTGECAIYVAGDLAEARRLCTENCPDPSIFVTVEAAYFIGQAGDFTPGARVCLSNQNSDLTSILAFADALAAILMDGLAQSAASIVGPAETVWLSRGDA